MEVSFTAWFIQKGLGMMVGRLDQEPSPEPGVVTLTLGRCLSPGGSSLVCLALAWMPPGKAILWAWITAPQHHSFHLEAHRREAVLSRSHSNSVARLTLGAPSMRGDELPPDLRAAPQT